MSKVHYYKIELNTLSDVKKFIEKATMTNEKLKLSDGEGYTVSASSMMGAIYALEWETLYLVSENDVYDKFQEFIRHSTIRYI